MQQYVITTANSIAVLDHVSLKFRVDQILLGSTYASPLLAAPGLSRPECIHGENLVHARLQHRRFVATL